MRSLSGVLLGLLLAGAAYAQTPAPVAPAQMGITPTTQPEVLQVLDSSGNWAPLGNVDSTLHAFYSGAKNITNILSGGTVSPVWTASWHAGDNLCAGRSPVLDSIHGTTVPPVFCGGTEGRQFAVAGQGSKAQWNVIGHTVLYLGTGYWMDTPGSEGPQNAQILALDGPDRELCGTTNCVWRQEVNLGASGLSVGQGDAKINSAGTSFCPTDNPICAQATSAIQTINWSWDETDNPVSVQSVVAASWWQGVSSQVSGCPSTSAPVLVFSRNNTDLLWYQTMLSCDPIVTGAGTPQVRSFGTHIDLAELPGTPRQYIFAGEASTGVFPGKLNNNRGANNNIIDWKYSTAGVNANAPEWFSTNYPSTAPQCTHQNRIMGFAEAVGSDGVNRIYMSVCFAIYYRVDGAGSSCSSDQVRISGSCTQRWRLYWQNPNPGTSQSGMRGLTTIPNENILLIGAEGNSPETFYAVKPYPGCASPTDATCATVEYLVFNNTGAATGMQIGATVAPYNNFPQVFDENGNQHFLGPQTSYVTAATAQPVPPYSFLFYSNGATGKKIAEGIYTYRNSAGKYNFVPLPQLFPTAMNGVRDMIASPFPQDCGYYGSNAQSCAIYATGFDTGGAGSMYWCKVGPCPDQTAVPPSLFVPVHNTAWAARLGYPGP